MVSVIIPTYNSSRTLKECLRSLRTKTRVDMEIIVVDSHSIDDTPVIAQEYEAKLLLMDGVPNKKRNFGFDRSTGKYVLHLDSDMVISDDLIEECLEKCERESADALELAEGSIALNFWAECIASGRNIFDGSDIKLPRFFRRSVLEKVRLDEDLLLADDYILYLELKRAGYSISKTTAKVMHYEPTSLRGIMRRYFEAYKGAPVYARRYGVRSFFPMLAYNARATARQWVFSGMFLRDPSHFLGLLFIKALRAASGVGGIVAGVMGRGFHSH